VTTTWIEPQQIEVPPVLRDAIDGHPLVAQLLAQKGISSLDEARAFLDPRQYSPTSPYELPGMEAAVRRLVQALQNGEQVVVWGDFDVDGITAAATLYSTLTTLGFRTSFYIPHRIDESHGLNQPALDKLLGEGVDLLLTCDCGVSDVEQLEYCRERDLDVIVTDHHDVPQTAPPAVALVDPKYLSSDHPLYELCGAGVAYKLAEALLTHFGRARMAEDLLDLAALGTVADIVPLIAENRYLVQMGLPRLAGGRRVGIAALARIAGIELSTSDTSSVGFALSPILNSSGRLGSADVPVHLLTTDDEKQAETWAANIVRLNEERRYQTTLAESMAHDMVEAMPHPLPPALVLSSSEWHQGVTGIVAGRLTEEYHRPAVLICLGENGLARGSARSVAGIDIHQAIVQQRDLLLAEGGHPMAAGFALKMNDLEEFRGRMISTIGQMAIDLTLERTVAIDAWIEWGELSLGLCDDLYRLAPFGEGNRHPILASHRLTVSSVRPLGGRDAHLKLRVSDEEGLAHDVLWWKGNRELIPTGPVDLAYVLKPNLYGGVRRLQVELVDLRRMPAVAIEIGSTEELVSVLDRRRVEDPPAELDAWLDRALAGESIACWGEGHSAGPIDGLLRRDELGAVETLVLWTVPPGPDELLRVLERAGARQVVLLFDDFPTPNVKTFLTELVGLIKFTVSNKAGQASVNAIAGVLATRRGAVMAGLELLAAASTIVYDIIGSDELFISRYRPKPVRLSDILALPAAGILQRALEEIAAYRRYIASADPTEILPAGYRPTENEPT